MIPSAGTTRIALVVLAVLIAGLFAYISHNWNDRPDIGELGWPVADATVGEAGSVTVTWFGISTLLFDDSETQIMIDGTFTRLAWSEILMLQKVSSDVAAINHTLAEFRINRLAAIVPVHSHFDHAMDIGHLANRSSALVLGSESTANIVRGTEVPVAQSQILASGESRQFGDFAITLIESRHAPIGFGDEAWFPGQIEEPLEQPARVSSWREGVSYSIVVAHPRGTTLIQGSAGFVRNNLAEIKADVVIPGVAGLAALGREYTDEFWRETVTMTGAHRVYPVHFDDFTLPLGDVKPFPRIADDVGKAASWLNELAAGEGESIDIERLPFGIAISLY
jgi:L-ascorbate metabolism protein UlaG (beta-lactamase superfamily)